MKKIFIIFLAIVLSSIVKAQKVDSLFTKKYIQKINVISPSVSGEVLLSSNNNNCLSASVKLKELLKFVYDYTRAISKGFSGVSSSVQD